MRAPRERDRLAMRVRWPSVAHECVCVWEGGREFIIIRLQSYVLVRLDIDYLNLISLRQLIYQAQP